LAAFYDLQPGNGAGDILIVLELMYGTIDTDLATNTKSPSSVSDDAHMDTRRNKMPLQNKNMFRKPLSLLHRTRL